MSTNDEIVSRGASTAEVDAAHTIAEQKKEIAGMRAQLAALAANAKSDGAAAPLAPSTANVRTPTHVMSVFELTEAAIDEIGPTGVREIFDREIRHYETKAGRPPRPQHSRQGELARDVADRIVSQQATHEANRFRKS